MSDTKPDLDGLPRYDRDEDAATVARRAAAEPDPRVRAAQLTSLLSDTQAWVEWISRHRDDAVRQMRADGDSYEEVARVLGLSKSRAQQLCRRLRPPPAPVPVPEQADGPQGLADPVA